MGTLNNPLTHYHLDNGEAVLKSFFTAKTLYVSGQLEKGESGTLHLQFALTLARPQRLSFMKKLCPHTHWTPASKDNGVHDYTMKDKTRVEGPWKFGVEPVQLRSKTDWARVRSLAAQNKLD